MASELSGDGRGALKHLQRALKLYRRHLTADHPAVGRAQMRLAQLRSEL